MFTSKCFFCLQVTGDKKVKYSYTINKNGNGNILRKCCITVVILRFFLFFFKPTLHHAQDLAVYSTGCTCAGVLCDVACWLF
uniref:Uncharacterized protein n=1 Tax=Anguilla anguilla TaxID=7936 RepID=A0A0E9PUI4_ANGAN